MLVDIVELRFLACESTRGSVCAKMVALENGSHRVDGGERRLIKIQHIWAIASFNVFDDPRAFVRTQPSSHSRDACPHWICGGMSAV